MSSVPTPQGIDPEALVRQWTPGAEAGDAVAMSGLSAAYAMKQDWEAAELWARRLLAGDLGVAGMWLLAEIREQRGDQAGAQEWKRRADEAHSRMPAGLDMARLVAPIVERFGEEPDPEQVRTAAQAGDEMAMTALGILLQLTPKERDLQEAVRWLTPGAEAGDALAIFGLYAALTEQGDEEGAARWLERAAESGMLRAILGDVAAPTGDEGEGPLLEGQDTAG